MNLKKRILSLALACALLVGLLVVPAGASGSSDESTQRADQLASLGLFQGTGGGYQLDRRSHPHPGPGHAHSASWPGG